MPALLSARTAWLAPFSGVYLVHFFRIAEYVFLYAIGVAAAFLLQLVVCGLSLVDGGAAAYAVLSRSKMGGLGLGTILGEKNLKSKSPIKTKSKRKR